MPLVDGRLEADRGSDEKSLPGSWWRVLIEKVGKACMWRKDFEGREVV